MKYFNVILLCFMIPCLCLSKTLWNEDNSIYSTKQRYKIGDTLKIIFNEKTLINYEISLSEEGKKSSTTRGVQGQAIDFLPALSGGDNFQNSQKSSTKNKGMLSKDITAQVTNILENGNLVIAGTHIIQVNDAFEQISIQGIVNPRVIKKKTTVYSTDIINPTIIYKSQIIKPDIIKPADYIQTFTTNVSSKVQTNISPQGKTNVFTQYQTNISSQYQISEQKKNELIIKYLNKILSILFKK